MHTRFNIQGLIIQAIDYDINREMSGWMNEINAAGAQITKTMKSGLSQIINVTVYMKY